MTTTTIKQRSQLVSLADGAAITVRRLRWKAACEFLRLLGGHLAGLGLDLGNILPKLPEIILQVRELAEFLIVNTTDLTAAQVAELEFVDMVELIRVALDLNTGAELKNSCAGIAATLTGLMPARMKTNNGGASTPSSSMPATAPIT